ncbi:collagen alpha-1(XX) chain-like [Acropora palmata]|uniref:collagen alpha-1(XX) chain-like n=1 Tax=Acropora palmata TaxID=6131 RepID=UPI003DA184CE
MIDLYSVGPDKTHFAIVAYSNWARVEFHLNTLTGASLTSQGYKELVDKIRFQRGFTFIDKALLVADKDVFTTARGMRPELPQIAIVITDGKQTINRGPYVELSVASRGLKDKNVNVYPLGIGPNVDQAQLEEVASSANNIFTAPNFDELIPVADTIVQNSCPETVNDLQYRIARHTWNVFVCCQLTYLTFWIVHMGARSQEPVTRTTRPTINFLKKLCAVNIKY